MQKKNKLKEAGILKSGSKDQISATYLFCFLPFSDCLINHWLLIEALCFMHILKRNFKKDSKSLPTTI